jgi:hypothetical protein
VEGTIKLVKSGIAPTLDEAVLSRRPGLSVVRMVFRGRARYVVSDVAAGRHLSVSPAAYRLLAGLDGERPLGTVGAGAGLSGREIAQLVPRLQLAGLLAGEGPAAAAAPTGPIEGRALFLKRELVELGPWLPRIDRAMGWLFHPLAAVAWLGLALMSLLLFVADDGVGDVRRWIAQFDAARLVALYLIFLALKLLHELGHALALWRMAAAEGLRIHSIRAGIAVMLIMPFPFTNVSSAWRLQSKWRRAVVGVAGMYVESWIAIAAVLLWAVVNDPLLKSTALQVATIAAVTTLLFNLNPFGRMDGYYVLADLAESPNLMQRASAAAVAVTARLFRVRATAELPPLEPLLLAYWVGILAYRLVVFAGLLWLAHALSPWVALMMLGVAVSLLLVRPAIATARRLVAMAAEPQIVRRRLILSAGLVSALFVLVPVPAGLQAVGIVEAEGARFLYPPRDVRVVAVASQGGPGDAPRLQLESPELADAQRQAAIRGAEAMARWRQALDRGGEGAQPAAEAVAAQQLAAEALAGEETRLTIPAIPGWDPLRAAEYVGSWVAPDPRAPLAVAIPGGAWRIRAVMPEAEADRLRSADGSAVARIAGRPDFRMQAHVERISDTAVETLPSEALGRPAGGPITVDPSDPLGRRALTPVVEVWLAVAPGPVVLRHGQRVELRFGTAARPLAWQAVEAALRLLDPGAGA